MAKSFISWVKRSVISKKYKLETEKSPTSYQLAKNLKQAGWRATNWRMCATFSEGNLLFNEQASETLEFKHQLSKLCNRYFPELMPASYPIDDDNWPQILEQISQQHADQSDWQWILKPSLLNNGKQLYIFENLGDIKNHYLKTNRLGGPHVLQRYLDKPHLLKGPKQGHKYSIRMFVILSDDGTAFLYPEGYFNIALNPYPGSRFDDLKPHLTNEHLSHDEINVIQIPTSRYELFKPFFPKIQAIVQTVTKALKQEHPQAFQNPKPEKLAFFGFDFMVDQQEKIWLLEANHGPCFPIDENHPLQNDLYEPFWQAVVEELVMPIASDRTFNSKKFISV